MSNDNPATTGAANPGEPTYLRAVSRWQIVGLSINDVIGSGIYLLPAATMALMGSYSVWAVLLAGLAVALLVLCYAQAATYFDQAGGSYLYAREALGPFIGFEIGWMVWLTRIASAAALSNGLASAVGHFWPAADTGLWRVAIIVASLGFLTWVNIVGVRSAARTGVVLVIAKLVPLLAFIVVGMFYVDWSMALPPLSLPPLDNLGEAALLLLFAYAGFENIPAAAGEYKNPRRDLPFALLFMIATVTLIYVAVQLVAQGTLPNLAESGTPLADAAATFGGDWAAMLLTVGAVVSILGTNSNTMMFGPRYLHALAADGYGPKVLAGLHPHYKTPVAAILVQSGLALALALSGSFVGLALLSMVSRLFAYIGTTVAVILLQRRHAAQPGVWRLPGGPLIPVGALVLSLGLMASASWQNLLAAGVALLIGAVIYHLRRKPTV